MRLIEIEGERSKCEGAEPAGSDVRGMKLDDIGGGAQTHLACSRPASRQHLFKQSQFPVRGGGDEEEEEEQEEEDRV